MFTTEAVVDALALDQIGPDRYQAGNVDTGGPVFGGQIMAQSLVAALLGNEGKAVKSLHTVFARGATSATPLEITVDRMQAGRQVASSSVTVSQGDRVCARSLVLLSGAEPDFLSHADDRKTASAPDDPGSGPVAWEVQVADGVDLNDPDAVGPPEVDVWTRWPGAPADAGTDQALIAFATDSFLIGAAMRPHPGVGQAQAHVTLTTAVLSHTISFHRPCPAGEWLLLGQRSTWAGSGRSFGHGEVFRAGGDLVASFVQDAIIRPRADRAGHL